MRANLGCGSDLREGWVNVDHQPGPGVTACELDQPGHWRFPAELLGVDTWLLSHVVEHVTNPLPLFEAMWHASTDDATAIVRCPYGSSDDAWEDPTHVRPWFPGSFSYLGQPFYWRADYDYQGDWLVEAVFLRLNEGLDPDDPMQAERVTHGRNMVAEMIVLLQVVKPAREPKPELQVHPPFYLIAFDQEPAVLGSL